MRAGWHVLHGFTVSMSVRFIGGQPRALRDAGISYSVVCTDGPELQAIAEAEGVTTYAVPMLRRISPLADLVALVRLCRVVRTDRPDAVHSHTPKAGLLLMMAAAICGIRTRVYHVHGIPWHTATGLRRTLLSLAERVACLLATHVICVSQSVRRELVAAGFTSADKARVLAGGSSNGVDAAERFNPAQLSPDTRSAIRRRYGIGDTTPVVGFVGRLVRDKGIVELTAAWQEVRRAFPDAVLLLTGPEEQEDPLPPATRAALADDPRVILHGADWNVVPVFAALDLLVLPTYREGFPNVLLEAGAMHLPVVATSVEGCVDAVSHEQTGLLVPSHDARSLAEAICRYLADAALRRRHGAAARARIEAGFSREAVVSALHAFYAQLAPTVVGRLPQSVPTPPAIAPFDAVSEAA